MYFNTPCNSIYSCWFEHVLYIEDEDGPVVTSRQQDNSSNNNQAQEDEENE